MLLSPSAPRRLLGAAFGLLALPVVAGAAEPKTGVPLPWQTGMQPAASPVMAKIEGLNYGVSVVIVVIAIFVGLLLAYALWRFSATRNPTPGTFSHNSTLEAAWTAIPVLILVGMFIPSIRLVYYQDRTANADLTVKVTGHQWYWHYAYPDAKGVEFDSYMVADEELKTPELKKLRHLAVDNQLVVPVGKNVRILTTSADVIHSFFVPSLGVQRYAIPGRTIETWLRAERAGDYYGECNQICGTGHSVMPIAIHAVSADEFKTWLDQQKAKASTAQSAAPLTVASEK